MDLNFYRNGRGTDGVMPTYTADASYAASSIQSPYVCVIAIGSGAASALTSRGKTGYSSYAAWSPGNGFIDAGTGLTNTQAFNKALTEATAARNGGF